MPKVSIITPAYNAQDFIAQTLQSVLDQSFQDFEAIVVDDGSTDQTRAIVEGFERVSKGRIRYIYQPNGGPAKARNRAVQEAKGEYIATLDADDYWMPNRLAEGVRVLDKNPKVALVHSRTIRVDESGKVLEKPVRDTQYLAGNIFMHLLLRRAHISCLTVLVRRSAIQEAGGFDEAPECVGVEDRDLWMRIAKSHEVAFLDQELGYYRVRAGGISRDMDKMLRHKYYVINKACAGGQLPLARRMALAKVHKECADEFLGKSQLALARGQYKKALVQWPLDLYCLSGYIKTFRGK